jgi:hypothetical protein
MLGDDAEDNAGSGACRPPSTSSTSAAPARTILNCAVGARDADEVIMTYYPRAAGWGTCDAAAHERRMRSDLPATVTNLVEDATSQVRPQISIVQANDEVWQCTFAGRACK